MVCYFFSLQCWRQFMFLSTINPVVWYVVVLGNRRTLHGTLRPCDYKRSPSSNVKQLKFGRSRIIYYFSDANVSKLTNFISTHLTYATNMKRSEYWICCAFFLPEERNPIYLADVDMTSQVFFKAGTSERINWCTMYDSWIYIFSFTNPRACKAYRRCSIRALWLHCTCGYWVLHIPTPAHFRCRRFGDHI